MEYITRACLRNDHILCSYTMENDLPLMGCDHAFHSEVIMTLVYSNNLRLTYGCFIRFENKQFDEIADVVSDRKKHFNF